MVNKKFTSVYHVGTRKKAEKTLEELRVKALANGWKETNSYIEKVQNGRFRVVLKQVKRFD